MEPTHDLHARRLGELAEQIKQGTYQVDARMVADAIVERLAGQPSVAVSVPDPARPSRRLPTRPRWRPRVGAGSSASRTRSRALA